MGNHHPFELFHKWAEESAEIACSIYRDLNVRAGSDSFPQNFAASNQVVEKWKNLIQMRMEVAAKNVVVFLKNIAVHRLHETHEKRGKGRHHWRKGWKRDCLKNIMVACVVVPLFFMLMRKFEQGKIGVSQIWQTAAATE